MEYIVEQVAPNEIEKRSFEMITEELGDTPLIPGTESIVKRCIHTSADFEYAQNLVFSKDALEKAKEALLNGAIILTDTNMGKAGINKDALAKLGCTVDCYIATDEAKQMALENGTTRAVASVDLALKLNRPIIFAVGNAPTALLRILQLHKENKLNPSLVIGVPVGFVNVIQSKELLIQSNIPHIVARGRKGGSNIAACIINALTYELTNRKL